MYTPEDARRRAAQLEQDRQQQVERRRTTQDARRPYRAPAFGAPYGNTSSYTPASDLSASPFVPCLDAYSPPAQSADPTPSVDVGGGTFDGGGASGDY